MILIKFFLTFLKKSAIGMVDLLANPQFPRKFCVNKSNEFNPLKSKLFNSKRSGNKIIYSSGPGIYIKVYKICVKVPVLLLGTTKYASERLLYAQFL